MHLKTSCPGAAIVNEIPGRGIFNLQLCHAVRFIVTEQQQACMDSIETKMVAEKPT